MPQAIVHPEELERFASNLKAFNQELGSRMKALQGGFARLGDTWRDQEQQKFAQEFEQTMQVLNRFMAIADRQIPFLQRKAAKAREYLDQH